MVPNGPAKSFWVLGHFSFEIFLRSACLEWLCKTLCSYATYLDVSALHMFKINIVLPSSSLISKIIEDLFTRCTFQNFAGYPWILDE
jgi:hypothetical protein